jgi:hypothetical protein
MSSGIVQDFKQSCYSVGQVRPVRFGFFDIVEKTVLGKYARIVGKQTKQQSYKIDFKVITIVA